MGNVRRTYGFVKVYAVKASPFDSDAFITSGARHIKFWTCRNEGLQFRCGSVRGISLAKSKDRTGVLGGKASSRAALLCLSYASNEYVYSGTSDGDVLVWSGPVLHHSFKAHTAPVSALLVLNDVIVTGAQDGSVTFWHR